MPNQAPLVPENAETISSRSAGLHARKPEAVAAILLLRLPYLKIWLTLDWLLNKHVEIEFDVGPRHIECLCDVWYRVHPNKDGMLVGSPAGCGSNKEGTIPAGLPTGVGNSGGLCLYCPPSSMGISAGAAPNTNRVRRRTVPNALSIQLSLSPLYWPSPYISNDCPADKGQPGTGGA